MKRKIITVLLSVTMTFGTVGTLSNVFAANVDTTKTEEQIKKQGNFIKHDVTINEINLAQDVSGIGRINAIDKLGEKPMYDINNETKIFSLKTMGQVKLTDLKEGQKVTMYLASNKPVIAIYPPQYTPDVVIVNDTELPISVDVDKYDKDGLNQSGTLKINVSDETFIVDSKGTKKKYSKDDLVDKNLLVFYSITTFSLPPQTPPTKVVILVDETPDSKNNDKANAIIDSLTGDQIIDIETTKYVRLKDVSEKLYYNLSWNEKTSEVTITKNFISIVLQYDKSNFKIGDVEEEFKYKPINIKGRTYVEQSFVKHLVELDLF